MLMTTNIYSNEIQRAPVPCARAFEELIEVGSDLAPTAHSARRGVIRRWKGAEGAEWRLDSRVCGPVRAAAASPCGFAAMRL